MIARGELGKVAMKKLKTAFLIVMLIPICAVGLETVPSRLTRLNGIVVDDVTGDPISDAEVRGPVTATGIPVRVQSTGNSLSDVLQPGPSTRSDIRGLFELQNLGEGSKYVFVQSDGYSSRTVPITLTAGQHLENMIIRMTRAGVISGRVFDEAGKPAVNVVITSLTYEDRQEERQLVLGRAISTDDRGEFRLASLTPRRYVLSLAPGRCSTSLLPRVGATNSPAESCRTSPLPVDSDPAPRFTPMLYPGVSDVPSAEWIDVKPGEEVRLRDMTLNSARVGEIRVHLINGNGEPAHDLDYYFTSITSASASIGGAATFNGVVLSGIGNRTIHLEGGGDLVQTYHPNLPGVYQVEVRWGAGVDDLQPSIPIPGMSSTVRYLGLRGDRARIVRPFEFTGEDLDVEIIIGKPEGHLEIRTLDEQEDGSITALPGVILNLCGRSVSCAAIDGRIQSQSHVDGTAVFNSLNSDRYDFTFASGISESRYVASVRQGDRDVIVEGLDVSPAAPPVEVRYKSGPAIVDGNVTDTEGHKIQNALVVIEPESSSEAPWNRTRSTRSDQDGRFELKNIIPGLYRVYAFREIPEMQTAVDPDILRSRHDLGKTVTLERNSQHSLALTITQLPTLTYVNSKKP
jgi:protocatechuate 3,4-dioxygenase beta subunit